MTRLVGALGLATLLASAGLLVGCSETSAGGDVDGAIQYGGDGPSYDFTGDGGDDAAEASEGGPLASLSSYFVDFGQVACGATASSTLTFVNNGDLPLVVTIMSTGTEFSVTPTSLTVPAGGMTADVSITATAPGSALAGTPLKGSLNVTTNDPSQTTITVPLSVTPTGATLAMTPAASSVTFPESEVGELATQHFSVTNSGNAATVLAVGPPSASLFSLVGMPDGGVPLNPGDTWNGSALFTASDTSAASAISIVSASGTMCGVSVSSIAFAGLGSFGHVIGWPATIDFGPSPCGGAAPTTQQFEVTNTTPVEAHVTSVAITPPGSGFSTDVTVGRFIGGNGAARPFHVSAPPVPSPSPLTPITATLTIQTDADSEPHTITLQEEPEGAVLAFDTSATPSFGSFGQVVLLLSSAQSFSVTNTGSAPADVTLDTSSDPVDAGPDASTDGSADATTGALPPPFTIADTSFSIGPMGTQSDSVTFEPTSGKVYVDGITMTATGSICSALPSPLAVSGIGLGGGASIAPSALAFAATCGGPSPDTQLVTLTNRGPADLTWALGPVTGPGAAQYTLAIRRPPGLLPAGQSAAIAVTAAAIPSPAPNPDPSALVAQFAITTDVPFDSPHVVPLTETPLGDQLSFSVESLRFGQFPLDHVAPPQQFTVTNAANPGSPSANLTLALTGDAGAVFVEPAEGGAVCLVTADGGMSGDPGACALPDAGDAGEGNKNGGTADAGDGGPCSDAADGGDCGVPPEPVLDGYVLAPQAVTNLGPSGGISAPSVVTFIPTAQAPYVGTVEIQTSDALCTALPAPIQLTGAGTQGEVSVSTTTLAFGTDPSDPAGLVNCGATGLTRTVRVTNDGNSVLHITGLSLGLGASSPYVLSGPGATLPAAIAIADSVAITVTPAAIPATVANPNDPSPFSDTLTITTDAMFDTPHTVSLVMQARGAIITNKPLDDTWSFGTVNLGSIGTVATAIQNVGNAAALVSINGLAHPGVFGLQNNPTTAAPNATTVFFGEFAPAAAVQSYSDSGKLVVSSAQSFCEPLPAAWSSPSISLSGSSTASSPITLSGSLAFPSSECGSAPPGGQSVTLTNHTNQAYTYAPSFGSGAFYTISDPGSGTIAAAATATVVVTPRTIAPGQGVQPGAAAYADSLIVTTAPAGATLPASGPAAPSFTIPVSWTLNGAVLSLPEGSGPKSDGSGSFYAADTASGLALPFKNTGTEAATVTMTVTPPGALSFSPAGAQAVAVGKQTAPAMTSTGSDAKCPATTSATVTFFYSGSICQPLAFPQVTVRACQGTFH